MAADTGNKDEVGRLKEELANDTRDVSDIWNDAIKNYKGIVGLDLKPTFKSVDDMISTGTAEMDSFHRFRHNKKKVDKLRSLFAQNLDYIQKGAEQLVSAATHAFPPAAAIGTALTLMLTVGTPYASKPIPEKVAPFDREYVDETNAKSSRIPMAGVLTSS